MRAGAARQATDHALPGPSAAAGSGWYESAVQAEQGGPVFERIGTFRSAIVVNQQSREWARSPGALLDQNGSASGAPSRHV